MPNHLIRHYMSESIAVLNKVLNEIITLNYKNVFRTLINSYCHGTYTILYVCKGVD